MSENDEVSSDENQKEEGVDRRVTEVVEGDQEKNEFHLLVVFIFRYKVDGYLSGQRWITLVADSRFPVQNEPFEYGVRVKNIGDRSFPGCLVEDVGMQGGVQGGSYSLEFESLKTPRVSPLNPGESEEIWFGEEVSLPVSGQAGVSCRFADYGDKAELVLYQEDAAGGGRERVDKYRGIDSSIWMQPFYVQNRSSLLQAWTNILVMVLTGIIVVESVVGLREVMVFALKALWLPLSWLVEGVELLISLVETDTGV